LKAAWAIDITFNSEAAGVSWPQAADHVAFETETIGSMAAKRGYRKAKGLSPGGDEILERALGGCRCSSVRS
jgi:hypothetical protein